MADSININILVVDDDPIILKSAERSLKPEGYHVEGALSGEEAIHRMEDNSFDLVFTDIRMPGTDGISLIKWIKQFRPAIDIVVITGYLLHETIKEAHRLGIIGHIMKPFTPEMLRNLANKTIERIRGNAIENETKKDFPASMLAELDKLIQQYRKRPGSAIPVLLRAQEIFGYLPSVIQERIARGLNMYPSEMYSIVSLYSCFRTKPSGDHIPCYMKGSERVFGSMIPKTGRKVLEAVNEYIKLRHGEAHG